MSVNKVASIVVGAVLIVGLALAVAIAGPQLAASIAQARYNTEQAKLQAAVPAAPVGDDNTSNEQTTLAESDAAGGQAIATEQAAEAAAALAAQQAAAAAQAAYAAAHSVPAHEWTMTHLPPVQSVDSGQPVPFVYDPAPQDANHGYYDTNACKSGSGSTINGVPLCD